MKVLSRPFTPPQTELKRLNGTKSEILIVTDEDHTRIPWTEQGYRTGINPEYLEGNKQAFHAVASKSIIIGATGLDFKSLQWIQEQLGVLTGFPPTDIEITDNGLEIRLNENGLNHEEWLDVKKDIEPNKDYESYIRSEVGYRREVFSQAMKAKIQEFGYIQVTDIEDYPPMTLPNCEAFSKKGDFPSTVVISYGESAIYVVKENSDLDYLKFTTDLVESIIDEYKRLTGKQIKAEISEHGFYDYAYFSPDNGIYVSKETALNEALKMLPSHQTSNLQVVIAAGDSANDKHLIPHTLQVNGKTIDRHSVITGLKLSDNKWFKDHPRIHLSPNEVGHIGPGILEIIKKYEI